MSEQHNPLINPLILESAIVYPDRIELSVCVTHARYATSSPALIDALVQNHPYLLEHACKNEVGASFGAVASTTSTPHVFEHLVIDNQMRVLAEREESNNSSAKRLPHNVGISTIPARIGGNQAGDLCVYDAILVGTTQWDDPRDSKQIGPKNSLKATVRISFFDDITAFAAINAALAELNKLLVTTY